MATNSRSFILHLVLVSCTVAFVLQQAYQLTMGNAPGRQIGASLSSSTTPNTASSPSYHPERPWQEVVADKVAKDNAKIPQAWRLDAAVIKEGKGRPSIAGPFIEGLLDDKTRQITGLDIQELVDKMAAADLTAVEVVTAFSKRAAYAHQLSNLLLEIGFDLALEQAQELDRYFKDNGKLIGPLHGIPVTLKDQFHIKGLETSAGFVGWIGTFQGQKGTGKEKVFESELVRELKSLGAVPIGKTTLMQTTWAPETNNNILGYTWNPVNQKLTSGGSSGGEAAMQALRGSAFGIGTDSGGSVSIPASYQGVFSIKPSTGRISFKGGASMSPGTPALSSVIGIMGHSVSSLRLVLKSLLSTEPWIHDPAVHPIPWRSENEYDTAREKALPAFGFVGNDGIVQPHPPIARALNMVKEALLTAGYEVLDWNPPSNNESAALHGPLARGDACWDVYEAVKMSGEPFVPQVENLFPNDQLQAPLTLREFEEKVIHLKNYRERWHQYWVSSAKRTKSGLPVQAVIAPVSPYAGALPGEFAYSPYISSVNVLDYTTVNIPVTMADQNIDKVSPHFHPLTDKDRQVTQKYDAAAHHGAPATVQIIGRRLDEERLLSMAQLVVDALNGENKRKL